MSFKPTSKIFDQAARRQAFSRNPIIAARQMKEDVKQKMLESIPTGEPIRRVRGEGFAITRRHSARGERPAVLTGEVATGGVAEKTGELSAVFRFSEKTHSGTDKSISEIAGILNEKERIVVADSDIQKANSFFQELNENALKSLL